MSKAGGNGMAPVSQLPEPGTYQTYYLKAATGKISRLEHTTSDFKLLFVGTGNDNNLPVSPA